MILRYPGSKHRNRHKILKYFPSSFKEYRESFCGGASIFFSIDIDKKRWINDINSELMSVYFALKERPIEFISKCRNILPQSDGEELVSARENGKSNKKYNKRLKEKFDYLVSNKEDPALSYFFINRTVWAGRVNYSKDMKSRMYFSNPEGWNIVKTQKLEKASSILKDVKITSTSYEDLLFAEPEYNYEDVLIYIDPPYFSETEMKRTDKLYQYGFSSDDHVHLWEYLQECPFKWVLSYDDNETVRKWYSGFNINEEEWAYCGSSQKKKKIGKELIITNFSS